MAKPKIKFTYAVVGINIKTYKVFLHMSKAADKKAAKAEFFELYKLGDYGVLEVVQLPTERGTTC